MLIGSLRSSIMQVEIPDECLEDFFVKSLQEGLETVRGNTWMKHPEDIVNNLKIEAAFVTLLEYYTIPSDFDKFIKKVYRGSNSNS
jgi:hypothetical protein